jgi:citrate lyase synthetase
VVNKLFYGFKHRFIHTEFTLTHLLETNGFNHVRKYEVGESNDPELTGVEQHMNEMGLVPNKVETIVMQAQKNG